MLETHGVESLSGARVIENESRPRRRLAGSANLIGVALLAVEIANASYLAAVDSATIFYHANVVAHVLIGIPLAVWLIVKVLAGLRGALKNSGAARAAAFTAGASALALCASGLVLSIVGTATPYRLILYTHIAAFLVGAVALIALTWMTAGGSLSAPARWAAFAVAAAILIPTGVRTYDRVSPPASARIVNPLLAPGSPLEEGAGDGTPFFPSSVRTVGDRLIPADF